MRAAAEEILCRLGLYRQVRNAYQRTLNRDHFRHRERLRTFFRQLMHEGDLVFDIGAHEGHYTELFLELGARVVALEPNPALAHRIGRRYRCSVLTVEAVAVGSHSGESVLHVGRDDAHSTLSPEWIQAAPRLPNGRQRWTASRPVRVETLDAMIARHGRPDFAKIDVEGYEREVFQGLHQPVPLVAFEFQLAAPEIARASVRRLVDLGRYRFNMAGARQYHLLFDDWVDGEAVVQELDRRRENNATGYGDIYARLASP
jgi:FkbM family methyltransferase